MHLLQKLIIPLCILIPTATTALAQGKDVEGSRDHPLVSRYPGSFIDRYQSVEFDEVSLPLGQSNGGKPGKSQRLEGKITHISYATPAGRSILEVYRNYESALRKGGFQILFDCVNDDCGTRGPVIWATVGNEDWSWGGGQRYLSAKLARAAGDVYVSLHIGQWAGGQKGCGVYLYVIESKPMEGDLIKVDAAALGGDISSSGHVAVYGIYFDTGKADLKPESDPALTEIAKLLQQDSKLKLLVVGHTDNVGTLAGNMDLSKRRAEAVVQVLTAKHGVAAARLIGQGAGPLAPVASNGTEDGRAKNRRVELVQQ